MQPGLPARQPLARGSRGGAGGGRSYTGHPGSASATTVRSLGSGTMVLDVSEWDGPLKLCDVDERPKVPLTVKHETVCIDKLGKVLTPSQVSSPRHPCTIVTATPYIMHCTGLQWVNNADIVLSVLETIMHYP